MAIFNSYVKLPEGISNRDPYCKYFFEARKFWGFGPVLTAVWQPNFVALPSASLGSKKKTDLKKLPIFFPSDVLKPHFSQRKKTIRFLDSSPCSQTHCTTLPRNVWYLGMRQKSSFFCWIWWEITYNNLAKHTLRLHGCSESPAQLIQHPYFLTEYDKLTEGNGLHVDDHLTVCIPTVPHSHSFTMVMKPLN